MKPATLLLSNELERDLNLWFIFDENTIMSKND